MADERQIGSSTGSGNEETEEDELTIQRDQVTEATAAAAAAAKEFRFELEKEVDHQADPIVAEAQEGVADAAKEIIDEENVNTQNESVPAMETHQFYPPGRIMHMVLLPTIDADPDEHFITNESNVGIYEFPRELCHKIRLSRTMINDHYMPMNKRTMELLIDWLAKDDDDNRGLTC